MTDLMALADRVEASPQSATKSLTDMHGYRVSFHKDGDFRFWRWGNEFYCASPSRVAAALRALAAKEPEA